MRYCGCRLELYTTLDCSKWMQRSYNIHIRSLTARCSGILIDKFGLDNLRTNMEVVYLGGIVSQETQS